MQFTERLTDTKNVDVMGINHYLKIGKDVDIVIDNLLVVLDFSVEIETREWGIKSIIPSVNRVGVDIYWAVSEDELTEDDVMEIEAAGGTLCSNGYYYGKFTISSDNDFELKDEMKMEGDTLTVQQVNIYLETRKIEVE